MAQCVEISFCIPTYNRAKYLDKILNSINVYDKKFIYEVRVQDNSSTDNTKQIFENYSNKSTHWFYEKNTENLGGKVNINKCTEKALGKYILIIGDDDYFDEQSFETLAIILEIAKANNNIKACFFNSKLQDFYNKPHLFNKGFEWLEAMGLNEPAFISSVLWEANYWKQYAYYEYIKLSHLPQLDCFVKACAFQKVLGYKKSLVIQTTAEDTDNPNFWFYKFHALVDCFEYPMLYNNVEKYGKLDITTRIIIKLRRIKLLKEIFIKINQLKKNNIKISIDEFAKYHHSQFYWPILYLYLKVKK